MLTRRALSDLRHDDDAGFTLAEMLVASTLAGIAGVIGVGLFAVVSTQTGEVSANEQNNAGARTALEQIGAEIRMADSPLAVPITAEGRFETFKPDEMTFYSNRTNTSRPAGGSRTPPSRVTISVRADASAPGKVRIVEAVYAPKTVYGTTANPYPNPYNYADNYAAAPTSATERAKNETVLASGIGNDLTKANNDATKPYKVSKAAEAVFTYCSSATVPLPTTTPTPTSSTSATPFAPDCDTIEPTGNADQDKVLALQISSVIIRIKVGGENYTTSRTDYQPATWLTTRVAVSGKVMAVPTASAPGTGTATP